MTDPHEQPTKHTLDTASEAGTIDTQTSVEHAHGPYTAIPSKVGHYRIMRLIGAGGMGAVYEAEQENPRRTVALKVMKSGLVSKAALRRFAYESQVLGRLRHPGIAQVYEAGVHDDGTGGVPYFAMEYIPFAKPLTDFAEQQDLSTRERLELFIKVCEAVHHGHQKGIIHRDLKPDNILIDANGQPKIIDFGVARATDSDIATATVQTEVGQLVGTVPYMSPEQIEADPADIDIRSDVYGLGVVLYKLLTGKLPYDLTGAPVYEATRIIREQQPLRLSTMNKLLRGDVETIVLHALEKDRERRYQSANALAQDIERYLHDKPILARPPSFVYICTRFAKRNKLLVASVFIVFMVLIGGVIGTSIGMIRANQALAIAKIEDAQKQKTLEYFFTKLTGAVDARGDDLHITDRPAHETRIVDFLDLASLDAATELQDEPAVQADIQRSLGDGYKALTMYEKAEQQYRDALTLQRNLYAPPNEDIAQTLQDLASILWWTGRYEEADPLFHEAYEMRRALTVGDSEPLANSMNYYAANLMNLNRLREAEQLFSEALSMRQRLFGDNDERVARALNNLAMCLKKQGEYESAVQYIKQATDIMRATRGDSHIDVANGLTNLASCLMAMAERYDNNAELHRNLLIEARDHLREALAIKQKQLRGDNVSIATTQYHLAEVLVELAPDSGHNEFFSEAEQLTREALSLQQSRFNALHPRVIHSQLLLSEILRAMEQVENANAVRAALDAAVFEANEKFKQHDQAAVANDPALLSTARDLMYFYSVTGQTELAAQWNTLLEQAGKESRK